MFFIAWRPPIVQHGPWPKPTNIYAKRAGKLVIWRVEAPGPPCSSGAPAVTSTSVRSSWSSSRRAGADHDRSSLPACIGSAPTPTTSRLSNIPDRGATAAAADCPSSCKLQFELDQSQQATGAVRRGMSVLRPVEASALKVVRLVPELARATRLWREAMRPDARSGRRMIGFMRPISQ